MKNQMRVLIASLIVMMGSSAFAGKCQIHKLADNQYLGIKSFSTSMSADACKNQAAYHTPYEICNFEAPTANSYTTIKYFQNIWGVWSRATYTGLCAPLRTSSTGSGGGTGGGSGGEGTDPKY